MADTRRIVHQWLETDAAFGASEVPVPKSKKSKPASVAPAAAPAARTFAPQPAPSPRPVGRPQPTPGAVAAPRPASAPPARTAVPGRLAPRGTAAAAVVLPPVPAGNIPDLPMITRAEKEKRLAALQQAAERELAAYLSEVCTRTVFGEGNIDADVMFIGEGPGSEEDRTGRPFVGKAGQFLDKQITAMGYQRSDVYIANVVKLRCAEPSTEWEGRLKDRPPSPEEVARQIHLLHQQIEIIRPQVIVTLGAPALKYVTGEKEGITRVRGHWLSYRGIPVMPTFHPAFVLRNYTEETRRKVWEDLKAVMKKVGK